MVKHLIVGGNIIEKGNKILLVQETLKEAKGKWNLPAGRLKIKEDIITCAKREGEEETGFKLKPSYLVGIYQHLTPKYNVILFVFKSKVTGGKLTIPKDIMDVKWLSFDEIKELNERELLRSSFIWKAIQDYKAGKRIPLDFISILD